MNNKLILAAGVALMLAFVFGCSTGDGDKEDKREVSGGSSSSIDSATDGSSSSGDGSSSSTDTSSSSVGDSSDSSSDDSSSSGDSSSSSTDTSSSSVGDSSSSASDGSSSSESDLSSSSEAEDDGIEKVTIGTQIWMKKNLDVDVAGRKCYDDNPDNCATYGGLYDWATAMVLPEECNTTACLGQINTPHQGICPTGWHIPTNAEWDELYRAVDGSSGTESPYESPTAGEDLKATSGWNNDGNGTNKSGFAALPGGRGYSGGSFYDVGDYGYWWSASEYVVIYAYYRYMYYDDEYAYLNDNNKAGNWFSVRCLQD